MKKKKTKRCSRCRRRKPISSFVRVSHHADGWSSHCRACRSVYKKRWYAKPANKKQSALAERRRRVRYKRNYANVVTPATKRCTQCHRRKSITQFYVARGNKSGRTSACRKCYSDRMKRYYWEHPEVQTRKKRYGKRRYHRTHKRTARRRRLYHLRCVDTNERGNERSSQLRCDYGITSVEYAERLRAQHHRCAICHIYLRHGKSRKAVPHVDHDHKDGRVRGLLCPHCNRGLGSFQDDKARLASAIRYLSK